MDMKSVMTIAAGVILATPVAAFEKQEYIDLSTMMIYVDAVSRACPRETWGGGVIVSNPGGWEPWEVNDDRIVAALKEEVRIGRMTSEDWHDYFAATMAAITNSPKECTRNTYTQMKLYEPMIEALKQKLIHEQEDAQRAKEEGRQLEDKANRDMMREIDEQFKPKQ